jgi:uncharacterized membrane protein (UPF0127 family)
VDDRRLGGVRTAALLAAITLTACAHRAPLPATPEGGFDPTVTVTFAGAPPLTAEVARRPDQRARGLMQRTAVPEGTGMAFLFPRRVRVGFWMKGTLVPLSIAYVDGDRVVSTAEMLPCTKDPCPDYAPGGAYTMAVEARAGFFPDHGVGPGTAVTLTGATAAPE